MSRSTVSHLISHACERRLRDDYIMSEWAPELPIANKKPWNPKLRRGRQKEITALRVFFQKIGGYTNISHQSSTGDLSDAVRYCNSNNDTSHADYNELIYDI